MSSKAALYHDVAQAVNRTLGRKAVTVEQINQTVEYAKRIRKKRGGSGLLQYLNTLQDRWFTPQEVERLKHSPRSKELSRRMLDLLVTEKVISPAEAMMLKGMLR